MSATDQAQLADLIDRLNGDLEDAVTFVARTLTPHPEADLVEVRAIDVAGVDVQVREHGVEHGARIEFDGPLGSLDEAWSAVVGLLGRARAVDPDAPPTAAERDLGQLASVRTFVTTVAEVADVHPHLRSITFVGGDLHQFRRPGPDAFVHVLAAPPGGRFTVDASFSWDAYAELPDEVRPVGAYYTVRRWDPEAARLEVLVVTHGHEAPGSAWAQRTGPGEQVGLWGPRSGYHPPSGTRHLLLVADDTGLPAVAAILERLPEAMSAHVLAEVDRPEEQQPLPAHPGATVRWCYRHGAPAGSGSWLVDAVRQLPELPRGTYAWGGGESRVMAAVRRELRRVRGLDRQAVSLVAYWRRSG